MAARVPGAGWYAAAGAAAFAGIAGAVGIVVAFGLSLGEPVRFLAPGKAAVEVASPGHYMLWHEHRTLFENRSFRADPKLPDGARITVLAPDGAPLRLETAGSQTWNEGNTERTAVGRFEARLPGRYVVILDGEFSPRVFAVAREFLWRLLAVIGGAIAVGLGGVATGIALAVYAFARRAEADAAGAPVRAVPEEAVASPGTDPERSLREITALVYGLQAASILVGITLIGGVIINYLQRDEAAGTWLESHFRWQIRTFWWTLAWSAIGFVTALLLVGFAILAATAIWFVYRVAKGWLALRAGKPVG